jgi:Fe-S oxidoreductase
MAQVIAANYHRQVGLCVRVTVLLARKKDTTRARANALREYLTHSDKENKFNHQELYEVFDLCVSCKACARMSL